MFRFISKWWNEIDKVNFLIIIAMAIIGVILSFSINKDSSLFNKHLLHSISAIVLMIIISSIDVKSLRRLSLLGLMFFTIMLITILLLIKFGKTLLLHNLTMNMLMSVKVRQTL